MEKTLHPKIKLTTEQEKEIQAEKQKSNSFLSKLMSVNTSPLSNIEMKNPLDVESDNYLFQEKHNQMTMLTENNLKLPASYSLNDE